jgi:hypothetical protein
MRQLTNALRPLTRISDIAKAPLCLRTFSAHKGFGLRRDIVVAIVADTKKEPGRPFYFLQGKPGAKKQHDESASSPEGIPRA